MGPAQLPCGMENARSCGFEYDFFMHTLQNLGWRWVLNYLNAESVISNLFSKMSSRIW